MALLNAAGSNDKETFVQALLSALSDFYNKGSDTNLAKLYEALASVLTLTDRDLSALLHDNFLSAQAIDEIVQRGSTALDRLQKEGAFRVDRIGYTPSAFIRTEAHRLNANDTIVTLGSLPVDFTAVRIFNTRDPGKIPVSFILDFSEDDNTITVAGVPNPGLYDFEYIDAGNIKGVKAAIQVPTELFRLGWDEGGFGNFGWDQ